jgi:hypothetical protein
MQTILAKINTRAALIAKAFELGVYTAGQPGSEVSEQPVTIAGYVLSNLAELPKTVEDARAAIEFIDHFRDPAVKLIYEGHFNVVCSTPAVYAYECFVHFLSEGVDDAEEMRITAEMQALFIEAVGEAETI